MTIILQISFPNPACRIVARAPIAGCSKTIKHGILFCSAICIYHDNWTLSISPRRVAKHFADENSTLIYVVIWCRRATGYYLNQFWPMSPLASLSQNNLIIRVSVPQRKSEFIIATIDVNAAKPSIREHDQGIDCYEKSMLKSMLANKDFLTWLLIGWHLSSQSVKWQVWKSLATNLDFNMGIFSNPDPCTITV